MKREGAKKRVVKKQRQQWRLIHFLGISAVITGICTGLYFGEAFSRLFREERENGIVVNGSPIFQEALLPCLETYDSLKSCFRDSLSLPASAENLLPKSVFFISEALKIQTVNGNFTRFANWLSEKFPLIHQHYVRTVVNEFSLVFESPSIGSSNNWLFYGHMDVVPGGDSTSWFRGDPFSGYIQVNTDGATRDGTIYGRGALDMKSHIVTFMLVIESALENCDGKMTCINGIVKGWTIALGHDEEIGGWNGASRIARYFEEKGRWFDGIIDEGVPAIQGSILAPFMTRVIASISVAERGSLKVKVSLDAGGGHSSIQKWHDNPINIMHTALECVQSRFPFPVHPLSEPTRDSMKMLLFPSWLLENKSFTWVYETFGIDFLVNSLLYYASPFLQPLMSSSMAVSHFSSGSPNIQNVIPTKAQVLLDIRIHPADSVAGIQSHLETAFSSCLKKSKNFEMEFFTDSAMEPSPVSSYKDDPEFQRIGKILASSTFEEKKVIVVPFLMVGATDTRHLIGRMRNRNQSHAFRISPFLISTKSDIGLIHGINESISFSNIQRFLHFYSNLIK